MSAAEPKLWNERDFDECCYPVGGVGRFTTVCAKRCNGCYCTEHRQMLDEAYYVRPKAAKIRSDQRRVDRINAARPVINVVQLPTDLPTLAAQIAHYHEIAVEDLIGHSRKRHICLARLEFYSWARQTGNGLVKIGKFCGGRDHSTVLGGIKSYQARMDTAFVREAA
jgi:hypothetical protein